MEGSEREEERGKEGGKSMGKGTRSKKENLTAEHEAGIEDVYGKQEVRRIGNSRDVNEIFIFLRNG